MILRCQRTVLSVHISHVEQTNDGNHLISLFLRIYRLEPDNLEEDGCQDVNLPAVHFTPSVQACFTTVIVAFIREMANHGWTFLQLILPLSHLLMMVYRLIARLIPRNHILTF
jgi:hypothetical protein